MKIALILAISAICFAGEALPASTANAVKAYDAEMAKAKAEYDKRDEAAKKVLVVALKKSQDAETKAGNLEGALAIKKRIDELTPKAGDLLGDNDFLFGKDWKRSDIQSTINTFNKDGTFTDNGGWEPLKWSVEKGNMILFWTNGKSMVFTIDKTNSILIKK